MIALLLLGSTVVQATATINAGGRDYVGLDRPSLTISGQCDGRPASAHVTKAYRGAKGGVTLRHGGRSHALPVAFAKGLLVRNVPYQLGLGCDGKRLRLEAHVVEIGGGADPHYFTQIATWDFRADRLAESELKPESAQEFAAHVQPQ